MALEIERKFLVDLTKWDPSEPGVQMIQAYLSVFPNPTVRVRVCGENAFLTVKGDSGTIARPEFEYEIPTEDALEMMKLAVSRSVEKIRYKTEFGGLTWEIDVFSGDNEGLVIAEVELTSTDQQVELPDWVLYEVTGDRRYYNSYLSENPFRKWKPDVA